MECSIKHCPLLDINQLAVFDIVLSYEKMAIFRVVTTPVSNKIKK